jgi:hypothetical protein
MLSFLIISKVVNRVHRGDVLLALASLGVLAGCASMTKTEDENVLQGTIAYPFAEPTDSIGHVPADKIVIKTTVGSMEYQVEIPGGGDDYDIQIPISELAEAGKSSGGVSAGSNSGIQNPQSTDQELVANLPRMKTSGQGDAALLDRAMGAAPKSGPRQSPSYALGLSKINELYQQRKYEYALIEINNHLSYYPTSPQLHKMKGTVLVRLGQYPLAEKAWQRALELAPEDGSLRNSLKRLQLRLSAKPADGSKP